MLATALPGDVALSGIGEPGQQLPQRPFRHAPHPVLSWEMGCPLVRTARDGTERGGSRPSDLSRFHRHTRKNTRAALAEVLAQAQMLRASPVGFVVGRVGNELSLRPTKCREVCCCSKKEKEKSGGRIFRSRDTCVSLPKHIPLTRKPRGAGVRRVKLNLVHNSDVGARGISAGAGPAGRIGGDGRDGPVHNNLL